MKEETVAIIEEARRLGLNSYEARVYLALMERDSLSVSEVSRISRVPRARIYDILDSLVADGLASLRPGRYKKYSATDPALFEEKLIDQNEEKYIERKKIIQKATLVLRRKFESKNKNGFNSSGPLEFIEIIKDPYQIHKRFEELIAVAKREVMVFTKPPYTGSREILEEQTEKQIEPLQRGIRIRGIYEIPGDKGEFEWWYNDIDTAARHGEEARVIKELPMKMAIFDERIVMLPLEDPLSTGTSLTTQVVEHQSLAKGLTILFNTLWEQAENYHILEDLLKKM